MMLVLVARVGLTSSSPLSFFLAELQCAGMCTCVHRRPAPRALHDHACKLEARIARDRDPVGLTLSGRGFSALGIDMGALLFLYPLFTLAMLALGGLPCPKVTRLLPVVKAPPCGGASSAWNISSRC